KEDTTNTQCIAGAGSTTVTILARARVNEGLRSVAGVAVPGGVRKGVVVSVDVVQQGLVANAVEVSGDSACHAATISYDLSEIGGLLTKACDTVGINGVITVEESSTTDTELEITEGMEFDKGYLSPYMVTDAERQEAVLDDPYILLTQSKISNVQDFLP